MAFDINAGLNSNTGDLSTDGVFMYSYISDTKTIEIKIKDGLNYKVKIPTDEELSNYVNGTWDSVSALMIIETRSINYLLSNFVATSRGLSVLTSYYLNLVPFRRVVLHCPELADHHCSSPASYPSSIARKILIDQQLGGVVNEVLMVAILSGCLSFRITDTNNKTINLYVQFSLAFSHQNY